MINYSNFFYAEEAILGEKTTTDLEKRHIMESN